MPPSNSVQILLVAAGLLLPSCEASSDIGELDLYSSNCSRELTERFSKMTSKQKSIELQKLRTANTTAIIVSSIMSEYVNWDEFLYDLPVMVTELGKLMLFSNKRDFTLYKKGVTYQHIRRPESFRATLVQLAHTEWNALQSAHYNMDTIRVNSIQIPGIFRMIFRIIARKKSIYTERQLKMQLDRVLDIARENKQVCSDSIEKIYDTIDLINEIQEATLSAQSAQADELNMVRKQKAELELRLNSSAEQLEKVSNELNKQQKKVELFEREYRDAQKKASPNAGEIFLCTLVDVAGLIPQMISNFGSWPSGGTRAILQRPGDSFVQENVNELQGAREVVQGLVELLKSKIPKSDTFDLIDTLIAKVKFEKFSAITTGLSSLLSDVKSAFQSMGDFTDEKLAQFRERLRGIEKALKEESTRTMVNIGGANSYALNKQLDQIGESSKSTYGIIMNARLNQLKMATNVLINANDKYEKLFNKKLEMIKKRDGYFAELTTVSYRKIDFEEILRVMREGIKSLARHVEQWKRLLEFFKIIERLTMLANMRTELFVNGTIVGVKTEALLGILDYDAIYMDMLYEHSFLAIDIARALHDMTSTYMRVSNTYVFPQLNGITKLLAIEDASQIDAEFAKLSGNAAMANTHFKNELKAEYGKQKQKIEDRVHQMACYIKVLSGDPDIKRELEAAVDIPDFS